MAAGVIVSNTVLTPGIEHHLELDAGPDQLIHEVQGVLRMNVVVVVP